MASSSAMSNTRHRETHANDGSSVRCPHCGQLTGIGAAAIFAVVHMAPERCEHCHMEFVIVNDVPMARLPYDRD